MKRVQKYGFIVLFTVILLCVSYYFARTGYIPPLHFRVQSSFATEAEDLDIFVAGDGNYYVFLPSYADMDQVTTIMFGKKKFSIGDVTLSDGMACGAFELETPYDFMVNNHRMATLWFYKSANIATMYIDTETGSMDYIHEDKSNKEKASITIYTVAGEVNYHSESDTLKGRGNATWGYMKRPYSLVLSSAADLLDMGTATNWVLLANAADQTNINNYLVYNLASRCGFTWVPECQYVDVYLNGEYSGLYLLSEKVEVGVNRLNIDIAAGDFLCKFELANRCQNRFSTNLGRTGEICSLQRFQESDYVKIVSQVNQMEQAILSSGDLSATSIIDLDSWVRRYLIDEISGNIDSDLASSYFYFSNGVFYAGPIWDYDRSFGNSVRNLEPHSFIAKNAKKSQGFASPYYHALYENQSFYNRMIEIYQLEFLPVLQKMVDGEIQSIISHIRNAAQMNSIRWKSMYKILQTWEPTMIRETADWVTYVERRIAFLNQAWLGGTDYCTIQFEYASDEGYWNISVPKGGHLETASMDLRTTAWVDTKTGEVIDFSQPIMRDMILSRQIEQGSGFGEQLSVSEQLSTSEQLTVSERLAASVQLAASEQRATSEYITFLSIGILLILFAGIVINDVVQRGRERRGTDE